MKRLLTLLAFSAFFLAACQSQNPETLPEVGSTVTAPEFEVPAE